MIERKRRVPVFVIAAIMVLASLALPLSQVNAAPKKKFILDYQKHLNRKFKKKKRKSTRYIIVHTSEAGKVSTLRTLSQGKSMRGRYRTVGGHSNYLITRDGQVYRILHHIFRADHSGLSMWNGLEDLSSNSVGIELVGYHYGTITDAQYRSLSRLLDILQRVYKIKDKNVLTHSQVSYGRPNLWFKRPHRGRKRCALNFNRRKAGLKDSWTYDPDVRAGRLASDRRIYTTFYRPYRFRRKTPPKTEPPVVVAKKNRGQAEKKSETPPINTDQNFNKNGNEYGNGNGNGGQLEQALQSSNVISKDNTAWNIAGEDYDDPATLYVLPEGRTVRGDALGKEIGWSRIPTGTRVMLNQPRDIETKKGPLFLITKEYTAWSFAGANYRKPSTFYFLANGQVKPGNRMSDWDSLPDGTRLIIGYKGPYTIQATKGKTPWGIAGRKHNQPETIYLVPGVGVLTGDKITDFNDLPRGAKLFLKIGNHH